MLPQSSFSPGVDKPREVPPPSGFRPLRLPLRSVSFAMSTEFRRHRGNSVAKENGLRYEAQVHEYFRRLLGPGYVSLELHVEEAGGHSRRLIPDGVFFHPKHLVVFEVKAQHMPEAWWQLRKLYQPALEFKIRKPVYVVEVCKSFDPAMPFPEDILWISDPIRFAYDPQPEFGVFHWWD